MNNYNSVFNPLINSNSSNFRSSNSFKITSKNSKTLWKNLNKINLNYIMETNDISTLQPLIKNLIEANVEVDEIKCIPEDMVLNLILSLQIIAEYYHESLLDLLRLKNRSL